MLTSSGTNICIALGVDWTGIKMCTGLQRPCLASAVTQHGELVLAEFSQGRGLGRKNGGKADCSGGQLEEGGLVGGPGPGGLAGKPASGR